MEAARVRDAAAGHEIAKELEGKVTRKVVKQTVMTIVYGVTFIGGRLQIERQLKDLDVEGNVLFKGSYYLVNKVFASIGEMFTAARGIQARFSGINTIIKSYSEQRAVPLFPLLIKQESPPPSPSKSSSFDRTPPLPEKKKKWGKIIVGTVLVLHMMFNKNWVIGRAIYYTCFFLLLLFQLVGL